MSDEAFEKWWRDSGDKPIQRYSAEQGWQAAEARLEPVIASLRRDLETPPPDVQEKVIQILDLVSRDALKKAVEDAVNAALLEALNKAKGSFTVEEAIGKIYRLREEERK